MAAPADWASRRFSFDFGVGVYPAILMRLRGTPARLEELIVGVDPEAVHKRPFEGKWSALEHAGHLVQIEALWNRRLTEYLTGSNALSAADMGNAATFAADYNSQSAESVCAEFRRVREAFLTRLDSLEPADFGRAALHPRLQVQMRLVDGLYFSAEHDDHELGWVWHLLRLG
jgi:uncharacterized damage-inducible protein DinB